MGDVIYFGRKADVTKYTKFGGSHVAKKAVLPVQNGTNFKVDFLVCLDPPRYHMDKKIGFHYCP